MSRGTPTLSDKMRADKQAVVQAMLARTQALRQVKGDTPLLGQHLSEDDQAARHLGEWYVLGRADAPVSDRYWTHKLETGLTPVQLKEWDFAMQHMWQAGKYIPTAIESLHPDLAQVYKGLREQGLHSGRVVLADAKAQTGGEETT